ncbi:MAG: hypothetical protein QUV35_12285 [Hydrogenophaga sp.]|uniref:hypothetical protein n=1 Tax=Hydrogenophaga sp. TaxID=1904254 RepID=UPI00262E9540|nr:hypothetical protein [Hydrogenophaga sp.]MDM7943398.1 hypothetical protein [Hydrogenophaga sp.]
MTLDAPTLEAAPAAAGRSCPLHYRYAPSVFASEAPEHLAHLDVLYVVGGLYGNEAALQRVIELFGQERGRARMVFNGDFHWFDADPAVFTRIQQSVLRFDALRGNVETELADENADADAGCGCAYPDWVGDQVVERSNRIHTALRSCVTPGQQRELRSLPMWQRADVGPLRLGLVHGDAQSLAGWGFAQEHLRDAAHREEVERWFDQAGVHAFASTHTCLPVFQRLRSGPDAHARWVFNNGATGMPNFQGDAAGLITRIALASYTGAERRFGVVERGVHVDAIAIEIDSTAWQRQFQRLWPEGSDAHASYFNRIQHGPAYQLQDAVRHEEN